MANYPMPSLGGPQYTNFAETERDRKPMTTEIVYADGGADYNEIGTLAGIRRWEISYDDLSPADAATLYAFLQTTGLATGCTLITPNRPSFASETITNVHIEKYDIPRHDKIWVRRCAVTLIKRPA